MFRYRCFLSGAEVLPAGREAHDGDRRRELSRGRVIMDAEKLAYFRTVLNEEMKQLLQDAGKTVSEMTSDTTNFPDPNDRATQESDRNFELRIRDRERKLINKITEALQRIDSGTFGICEVCDEEIGEARLRARSVTTLCIDCKMEQERQEKRP
jgi:DnaK suppressor protein